jgi:DNA mismatch endonuclease (patch repair protein)
MSRIRSTDTKPELALRKRLFAKGMRFRTRLKLAGKPDIAFTRARLAVFIDGCFWHGCPLHGTSPKSNSDYWNAKLQRNRERDRAIDAALAADGWEVVRYWEHEIKEDVGRVADEIQARWQAFRMGASTDAMPSGESDHEQQIGRPLRRTC